MACRNRVDAVSRNGQRVATVSKKFDFSDTPRGVSDAVSGRVGTYRRVGERPTLRHSMVRGVRASQSLTLPDIIRRRVDFPVPLGPTMASI